MTSKDAPTTEQQRIEAAFIDLIARDGYDAVTVSQVVTAAHVGRTTFYVYYADKDDLMAQLVTTESDRLTTLLYEQLTPGTDWGQVMTAILAQLTSDRRRLLILLTTPTGTFALQEAYRQALRAAVAFWPPASLASNRLPEAFMEDWSVATLMSALVYQLAHGVDEQVMHLLTTWPIQGLGDEADK